MDLPKLFGARLKSRELIASHDHQKFGVAQISGFGSEKVLPKQKFEMLRNHRVFFDLDVVRS